MSLTHKIIEINDAESTLLTDAPMDNDFYIRKINISVQNLDSEHFVFLGNSEVSNSSFGIRLDPAEIVTLDVSANDELYAISDSGTFNISILKIDDK
jgi:hypothetical protein